MAEFCDVGLIVEEGNDLIEDEAEVFPLGIGDAKEDDQIDFFIAPFLRTLVGDHRDKAF